MGPGQIETMWTVREVAAFLRKSTRWVYEEAAAPPDDPLRIPCTRIGGNLRFDPPRVIAWAKTGVPSRSSRSRRRYRNPPDDD